MSDETQQQSKDKEDNDNSCLVLEGESTSVSTASEELMSDESQHQPTPLRDQHESSTLPTTTTGKESNNNSTTVVNENSSELQQEGGEEKEQAITSNLELESPSNVKIHKTAQELETGTAGPSISDCQDQTQQPQNMESPLENTTVSSQQQQQQQQQEQQEQQQQQQQQQEKKQEMELEQQESKKSNDEVNDGAQNQVEEENQEESSAVSEAKSQNGRAPQDETMSDAEGLALLRLIFPDLSQEELLRLHSHNVNHHRPPDSTQQQQVSNTNVVSTTNSRSSTPTFSNSTSSKKKQSNTNVQHKKIIPKRRMPKSNLGQRIWNETIQMQQQQQKQQNNHDDEEKTKSINISWQPIELDDDFLRLPSSVAVRRYNEKSGKHYYLMVDRLHHFVLDQQRQHVLLQLKQTPSPSDAISTTFSSWWNSTTNNKPQQQLRGAAQSTPFVKGDLSNCYTRVLERHPKYSLGMTLSELSGRVWIHSILGPDAKRIFTRPKSLHSITKGKSASLLFPAMRAGISPGDWLMGINGKPLLYAHQRNGNNTITTTKGIPGGPNSLLQEAVNIVQFSQNPVVLTLERVEPTPLHPMASAASSTKKQQQQQQQQQQASSPSRTAHTLRTATPSLLDQSVKADLRKTQNKNNNNNSSSPSSPAPSKQGTVVKTPNKKKQRPETFSMVPRVHPFILAMARKNLIGDMKGQVQCTERLQQFTERARQWENFSSFRIDAQSYDIRSHFTTHDLPPAILSSTGVDTQKDETASKKAKRTLYGPSTPMLDPGIDYIPPEYLHLEDIETEREMHESSKKPETPSERILREWKDKAEQINQFPGPRILKSASNGAQTSDIVVLLMSVRKALCVRLVNTFVEGDKIAYTIWVFDVESGREWYAPVRYLADFCDLRRAVIPICPSLSQIPFPSAAQRWNVFGTKEATESESLREAKVRQLEYFLRRLCALLYTDRLHPMITEIAIHLQSFLGCDFREQSSLPSLQLQTQATLNEAMCWQMPEKDHSEAQMIVRLKLKRAIQRYTFRLFLLDEVQDVVNKFVDVSRARGPSTAELESLAARGRKELKERAMADLELIQGFLDQMQTMILDGCYADFESMSQRVEYSALEGFMMPRDGSGKAYLERVIREAVREQVEIEVYVPLRGVVSRLLVNGWRHDDLEIHFKMQELRRRPQSMFRIPPKHQNPAQWTSASSILNEGVGMSTLPCAKLRAIVDAAKEIMRIHQEDNDNNVDGSTSEGEMTKREELSADDFLPIFIYCVVRAEMERPCALCVLLTTLCEPTNRIGEIGYFLASFEAAIMHIQEVDLAEK